MLESSESIFLLVELRNATQKGGENMEIKITGAEEALKNLDRASQLIKELKDIIYKLGNLCYADIDLSGTHEKE